MDALSDSRPTIASIRRNPHGSGGRMDAEIFLGLGGSSLPQLLIRAATKHRTNSVTGVPSPAKNY